MAAHGVADMNREEAAKCFALGERRFHAGELGKATRLLEKAARLDPQLTPKVTPLLRAARVGALLAPRSAPLLWRFSADRLTLAECRAVCCRAAAARGDGAAGASASSGAAGASSRGSARAANGSGATNGVPRRRATAPASAGASGGSTAGSSGGAPGRSYTAAQETIASTVKNAKSLYDVLGVAKTASDDQLRKAYMKLSRKVHPDKNSAPSAQDAFKRLGHAYATLSDAEKRKDYDRFGEDGPNGGGSGASGRGGFRGGGGVYYQEEMSPEEIFSMFFGGGFAPRGRAHMYRRQQQQQRHAQGDGDDAAAPRAAQLLQLMPIILFLVLPLLFNLGGGSGAVQKQWFSLDRTSEYTVRRETSHPYVVPHLAYWVRPGFEKEVGTRLYDVENAVQTYVHNNLRRKCQYEKQMKRRRVATETPSCTELVDTFGEQRYGF